MTLTRRGALAALLVTTLAVPAAAQEVTLRLHQFLPAQANVPAHILDVWADRVEAASDGRIEIQRFPAMQLGGRPPELADQVRDGVVDIVWTLPGYTPGRFPSVEVMELPFLLGADEAEAGSRAYWQLAQERMAEEFADYKLLGLWVHGPGIIHANRPIVTPSDLAGLKLRAPTRITNQLFTDLGATSVGMPVPAVPESLSKGVIDGAVIPWEVTGALRTSELVDNHTEFGDAMLYTAAFLFAMNKASYDRLPDDLKAVIDANSGLEFSGFAGRQMAIDDGPAREATVAMGNTIITLDEAQVAEWRAASAGTIEAWVAEMDAAGKDGSGLLARAQALIEANRGVVSDY